MKKVAPTEHLVNGFDQKFAVIVTTDTELEAAANENVQFIRRRLTGDKPRFVYRTIVTRPTPEDETAEVPAAAAETPTPAPAEEPKETGWVTTEEAAIAALQEKFNLKRKDAIRKIRAALKKGKTLEQLVNG